MEPVGSLPHYSQVSATCPYPEPVRSSPSPTPHCLKIHLNFILTSTPPSGSFPSGFPTKTLYTSLLSPTRATYPAHLILLDFITQIIFGEEYRLSSSLCSFLHSPVTYPSWAKYSPQHPILKIPQPTSLPHMYVYSLYIPSWHTHGKL